MLSKEEKEKLEAWRKEVRDKNKPKPKEEISEFSTSDGYVSFKARKPKKKEPKKVKFNTWYGEEVSFDKRKTKQEPKMILEGSIKAEPVKKKSILKPILIFSIIVALIIIIIAGYKFGYLTTDDIFGSNSINAVNSINDDQLTEICFHNCIMLTSTYTTPMDIKNIFQNKTGTYCVCGGTKIEQFVNGSVGDMNEIRKEVKIR
jgi:hypothetical protein